MKKEWLDKSFELLKESPKTVGIYLTKVPNKIKLDDIPDNAWMGGHHYIEIGFMEIESIKGKY